MPHHPQCRKQQEHSLAVEVLRKAGRLKLAARGYSMLPTLWPGDLLTVEIQSIDQTRVGDIVLFVRENRFFVHRVVRLEGTILDGFITRGDAMPEEDGGLDGDELLGRVVSVSRGGKEISPGGCSWAGRLAGLALAYSDRLRSLVLGFRSWHASAHSDCPAGAGSGRAY